MFRPRRVCRETAEARPDVIPHKDILTDIATPGVAFESHRPGRVVRPISPSFGARRRKRAEAIRCGLPLLSRTRTNEKDTSKKNPFSEETDRSGNREGSARVETVCPYFARRRKSRYKKIGGVPFPDDERGSKAPGRSTGTGKNHTDGRRSSGIHGSSFASQCNRRGDFRGTIALFSAYPFLPFSSRHDRKFVPLRFSDERCGSLTRKPSDRESEAAKEKGGSGHRGQKRRDIEKIISAQNRRCGRADREADGYCTIRGVRQSPRPLRSGKTADTIFGRRSDSADRTVVSP